MNPFGQLTHFATTVVTNCTGSKCDTNFPGVSANNGSVQTVVQIAFAIIGTLAVIYLLFASIQMITSQGDPQTIAKSRQAILYAVVGIVVAVSAELIVTFVLGKL